MLVNPIFCYLLLHTNCKKMEKEFLVEFVASYFYKKGHKNAKLAHTDVLDSDTLSDLLKDCKKAYKEDIDEQRKQNPHHHTNRLD